jgi:hypothetical protein
MKFALTITDASPSELATLLATLGASTATGIIINHSAAGAAATTAEDDDNDTSGDSAAVTPGTLDKNGVPWDARIHSTPPTMTKKNVWRAGRGVDKAVAAAIENELRTKLAGASAPVMTDPAHTNTITQPAPVYQAPAPVFDPNQAFGGGAPIGGTPVYQPPVQQQQQPAPVQQYQPPVQQQPVYQPAPVQQPQAGQFDFNAFMQKVQVLLQSRDANGAPLIDANYLNNVSQRVGAAFQTPVAAITDLMPNQAMIDYAIGMMFSEGKWA